MTLLFINCNYTHSLLALITAKKSLNGFGSIKHRDTPNLPKNVQLPKPFGS
jgi:hypothetical protein